METNKEQSRGQVTKPFYALVDDELSTLHVTDGISFTDKKWYFPHLTPGSHKSSSTINWEMRLFDGSSLCDPHHANFLLWCRKLIASLLFSPAGGTPPSPGTMIHFQIGIKWLVSWMSSHGYRSPHELTPTVVDSYIEDIPGLILDQQDDEGIGSSQVQRALYIVDYLWRQRRALAKWGIPPMPRNPLSGETTASIAHRIATRPEGWIKPLPDEIAIPLFNRAAWFLGTPAEDVLRLLAFVGDPEGNTEQWVRIGGKGGKRKLRQPSQGNGPRLQRYHSFLDSFTFSTPDGEDAAWHPPFFDGRRGISLIDRSKRIRQLFEAVRDSCVILIQGTTGMRISEVLGIKSGINPENGLPHCVRLEDSITGLYEWFIIRTDLSKSERVPRPNDWIIGMRPKGTHELPLAVRALVILNRLYEPWRGSHQADVLLLGLINGYVLPRKTTILRPISRDALSLSLKRYIQRWINLTNLPNESTHKTSDNDLVPWRESNGEVFSSHMLRKSWAQFTLAVDPRLLPAIQMQFHHLSLAMTEVGYIGNNPLLLDALDSVARQERNLMVFESATGKRLLAGRMGDQIESAIQKMRPQIQNLPTSDAWKKVVSFCDDIGLHIFFSAHGKCCPTRPSEMRCHEDAGSPTWLRLTPNHAFREPSRCAGCACFVLDSRHQAFWENRYLQNWISYGESEKLGISRQYNVVKERAEQAGRLLRKMGVDTIHLDEIIQSKLKVNDAKA